MRVAVYGCSLSYGVKANEYISWVNYFTKLRPDLTIDNYANSGSSLLYSIEAYEDTHKMYNKTIFQITLPNRITYYKDESIDWQEILTPHEDGYRWIDLKNSNKYFKFLNSYSIEEKQFVKDYYTRRSVKTLNLEHEIFSDYIKSKPDFVFAHYSPSTDKFPVVSAALSTEQFENYKIDFKDDSTAIGHFNKQGCEWQAHWVNSLIDF